MKNKKLQKWLSELPENAEVCLSKVFFIKNDKGKEILYTCRLDIPIIGLVRTKDNKEICFMMQHGKRLGLGKMRKINAVKE